MEAQMCSKCVMTTDYSWIYLDEEGMCNLCRQWEKRWGNYDYEKAGEKLKKIFQQAKAKKRPYDCLITYSGGRDSSYVLYLCKEKYGLNPLAVTFNNGFMSDYAISNIFESVKKLNVPHILFSYDMRDLLKMYREMVVNTGEFCSICSNGINMVAIIFQQKFKIHLIVSGTSTRTDEQSPLEVRTSHPVYIKKVLKRSFPEEMVEKFVIPRRNDLTPFQLFKLKISGADYRNINLPDYMPWNNEEIQRILMEKLNWKTPDMHKDHIDCKYGNVKSYFKEQQLSGYIYLREKYSQLIRDGQMSREDAIKKLDAVKEEFNTPDNLDEFLSLLDLKYDDIKDIGKKSHLDFVRKEDLVRQRTLSEKILMQIWKGAKAIVH
ncbi:MAG: N-acetyl sugar amidotransferase [Calditrichia bacterium]